MCVVTLLANRLMSSLGAGHGDQINRLRLIQHRDGKRPGYGTSHLGKTKTGRERLLSHKVFMIPVANCATAIVTLGAIAFSLAVRGVEVC